MHVAPAGSLCAIVITIQRQDSAPCARGAASSSFRPCDRTPVGIPPSMNAERRTPRNVASAILLSAAIAVRYRAFERTSKPAADRQSLDSRAHRDSPSVPQRGALRRNLHDGRESWEPVLHGHCHRPRVVLDDRHRRAYNRRRPERPVIVPQADHVIWEEGVVFTGGAASPHPWRARSPSVRTTGPSAQSCPASCRRGTAPWPQGPWLGS